MRVGSKASEGQRRKEEGRERELERREREKGHTMRQDEMKKVLEMGVLLSAERDMDRLLDQILSCAMDLARCDGGTLYLLDGDVLRFKIMRTDSLGTRSGRDGRAPDLPPVRLSRENVCALALLEDRTISIQDVYHAPGCDFSGPIAYDALTGYHTQSMLVVPMRGRRGERVGVLQLINALDSQGNICAFQEEMALVLESLASQAAVTIQNVRYIREIRELFASFVRVMSAAVDERSPYNANHSRRMAQCGGKFVDWLNARAEERGEEPPFPPARREELLMSIWLHDIGKVTTPLEVMDKANRLPPLQYARLDNHLLDAWYCAKIDCLEGRITEQELESITLSTCWAGELTEEMNEAEFLSDEQLECLAGFKNRTYTDRGYTRPWITDEEYAMLTIRKGTLAPEELEKMRRHVVMTDKMLSQIHFSRSLSHVRSWAASHHEKLNGTGYPRGLKGEEIPYEVRIITILDIFDALVADDRPYKPGMPIEKALDILTIMAKKEGKLDPQLTELFIESKCWVLEH